MSKTEKETSRGRNEKKYRIGMQHTTTPRDKRGGEEVEINTGSVAFGGEGRELLKKWGGRGDATVRSQNGKKE